MPASVVWIGLGCVLVIYLFSFGWNPGARVAPEPFWGWTGSPIAGVERQECQPRRDAGAELNKQVDPDRRPGEQAGAGAADCDRRVEHTAGDAAHGERAGRDGEPDRQPEEPVALLVLAGRYVQHHVAQGEGDQQ